MSRRKMGNVFTTDTSKGNPVEVISMYGRENPGFTPDNVDIDIRPTDEDTASGDSDRSSGVYSVEDNNGVDQNSSSEKNKTHSMVETKKKDGGVQMKKSLNLFHCIAIMVAVTGHSSVFISPSNILRTTGSVGGALVVWLIGGLINMMLALCFAELGTMLPKAGGPYAYVMKTFGPLPGFLIMWGYVVLIAGPFWAFLAYTAALYIIQPVFQSCEQATPDNAVKLLAGWIMSK